VCQDYSDDYIQFSPLFNFLDFLRFNCQNHSEKSLHLNGLRRYYRSSAQNVFLSELTSPPMTRRKGRVRRGRFGLKLLPYLILLSLSALPPPTFFHRPPPTVSYHLRVSNPSTPRLYDCFLYFMESYLLLVRLRSFNPLVAHFVLGFANHSFARPADLENLSFSPFESEIGTFSEKLLIVQFNINQVRHERGKSRHRAHIVWRREHSSRDHLVTGLNLLNPRPHDLILVCDLDELPLPSVLAELIRHPPQSYAHFRGICFYYSMRWLLPHTWYKPFVVRYSSLDRPLDSFRHLKPQYLSQETSLIHCSYCFPRVNDIIRKLISFPHIEYSAGEFIDPNRIYPIVSCGRHMGTGGQLKLVDFQSYGFDIPEGTHDWLKSRMPFTDLDQINWNRSSLNRYAQNLNCTLVMDRKGNPYGPWF
jgi:hypothetical protein